MVQQAILLVVALLGAVVVAQAQPAPHVHRIGILAYDEPSPQLLETFREGLRERGYVEGQNITIEVRNAEGKNERPRALVDELLRVKVDVILTVNTPAAQAAKQATATIPIVIVRVADPVKSGLVPSLAHPGGNVTGLSFLPDELGAKRLQLLTEFLPGLARVAVLYNADNLGSSSIMEEMERASAPLGLQVLRLPVRGPSDFGAAFQAATSAHAEALAVQDDAASTKYREQILDLAAQHALPVGSQYKDFAEAGGLIASGPNLPAIYRRAAYYVDRILQGAKPADLPVEQPTQFDLVINLQTAKQLGITIPSAVLYQVDQVIR